MNVKAQKAAEVRCYGIGVNEGRSGYRSHGESMKHREKLLRNAGCHCIMAALWLHWSGIGRRFLGGLVFNPSTDN